MENCLKLDLGYPTLSAAIIFTFTIQQQSVALDFVTIALYGFGLTPFVAVGFELGVELTYPESEATTSSLLMVSSQIFGIIITQCCQSIINGKPKYDEFTKDIWTVTNPEMFANILMICCLAAGLIITMFIKEDLKRQDAEK